jgi:hypothetical protein
MRSLKPEGKRPLGRAGRIWEDVRIDLREIGWEGVNWIYLAQDRDQERALVNTVMNHEFLAYFSNYSTLETYAVEKERR